MSSASSAQTVHGRSSVSHAAKADELARRRTTRRRIDRPEMQGETCCSMYRTLGAHPDVVDGAAGTRFGVWAPNAKEVSVLCNANGWKPGRNWLNGSDSGIWSGFMPGIGHGDASEYPNRPHD